MTKILITLQKIKIKEPLMLFWSFIPLVVLIVTTNYIFNTNKHDVLGTNVVSNQINEEDYENIKNRFLQNNQSYVVDKSNAVVSFVFSGLSKGYFEETYPLFKQYGYKASISVVTSELGNNDDLMSINNVRLLQNQGWDVVSQSRKYICNPEELKDPNVVYSEVAGSKQDLKDLGLYTNIYLPACGFTNSDIYKTVSSQYKGLINFGILDNQTKSSGMNFVVARSVNNTTDIKEIESWIKSSKMERRWLVLIISGMGDSNLDVSFDRLKDILNYSVSQKVQVLSIGQVLKI